VRCGGSWKRNYGTTYTGTKGEIPDTDKVGPSEPPRQLSTLPATVLEGNDECEIGVTRYARNPGVDRAEIAVVVADA
jgi:hypothetical protein